jgi:hypothetical protein
MAALTKVTHPKEELLNGQFASRKHSRTIQVGHASEMVTFVALAGIWLKFQV